MADKTHTLRWKGIHISQPEGLETGKVHLGEKEGREKAVLGQAGLDGQLRQPETQAQHVTKRLFMLLENKMRNYGDLKACI